MTETREQWLSQAAEALASRVLADAELEAPANRRVSCGWPSKAALSRTRRTIGQCWPPEASADGTIEHFVSPVLADPVEVLDTLTHELIHGAVGCEKKHGPAFKRACDKAGLVGKPTANSAGPELWVTLDAIAAELGPYPHAKLDKDVMPKQGTRLIKVECPACGYTVRTTRKWIEVGLPTCPCKTEMEVAGQWRRLRLGSGGG